MRGQRDIPDCLNRRYRVVDQLVNELDSMKSDQSSMSKYPDEEKSANDHGLKLMCDFWNILKQDPSCDLSNIIQEKMRERPSSDATPSLYSHQRSYTCYVARENRKAPGMPCCPDPEPNPGRDKGCCNSARSDNKDSEPSMPLSKVLCNLKEAASFDQKCTKRLNELLKTEKVLQEQIKVLEERERAGAKMLKEADCMWSCMEDAYKQKISDSGARQQVLTKQLKEIENSTMKWRKNKKDLESQLDSVKKCQTEISDKTNQKKNDMKCMDIEIEGLKKRIDASHANTEAAKKSLSTRKQESDKRIADLAKDVQDIEKKIKEHQKQKETKEEEANIYVKEAREDLQQICRVLLRKKLENEDLTAEKNEIINEIKMLEESLNGCKDRCKRKQEVVHGDMKLVDVEVENFKLKCIQCHKCTDTNDIRRFCTDCPLCLAERDCLMKEDGFCDVDHTTDCVCQRVKTKFLDNVFENMSTVLAKQVKTKTGKVVAESVLKCLKKSKNGKLNSETKELLREFILTTVKRNLNLTIVGGAVKTRCELDPETYSQLMNCLKQVTISKPPMQLDKGTVKKDPCTRWGGASECFCPQGPKTCVCNTKAPPRITDPTPCPVDKEDEKEEPKDVCPSKKPEKCGVDCGMRLLAPRDVDLGQWIPDPCRGTSCPFEDSQTAQFMFSPTSHLSVNAQTMKTTVPLVPSISVLGDQIVCKCGKSPETPCVCSEGTKQLKADSTKKCDKDEIDNIFSDCEKKIVEFDVEEEVSKIVLQGSVIIPVKHNNDDMKIPSVQKEVFEKSLKGNATEPSVFNDPGVLNKRYDSKHNNIFELKISTSGTLALDFSDYFVMKYLATENDKSNDFSACLTKTDSGHMFLNFNADPTSTSAINMKLHTSQSGKISLNMDKNLTNILHSKTEITDLPTSFLAIEVKESQKLQNDVQGNDQKLRKSSDATMKDDQHRQSILKEIIFLDDEPTLKNNESASSEVVRCQQTNYNECKSDGPLNSSIYESIISEDSMKTSINEKQIKSHPTSIDDYKHEFLQLLECQKEDLNIKLNSENGVTGNINATITKTESGQVALNLKNLTSLGDISSKDEDNPVCLRKSPSGNYSIFIGQSGKEPNTVFRRTSSGDALVILTETVLTSMYPEKMLYQRMNKSQAFEINIKGLSDKMIIPPAILKCTSSGNYVLVLDKEFEKQHGQKISLSDFSDCVVELKKVLPTTLLINFDIDIAHCPHSENLALLVKSEDNIKVVVNGQKFDGLRSGKYKSDSRKAFSKLLSKLAPSKSECAGSVKNLNSVVHKQIIDIKSSSDSQLYEYVRLKLKQQDRMWSAPSAMLKKTSSGQFAVVMDKDTKKTFFDDVQNYLQNNSQTTIPIKRTDSGEITINLTGENKGQRPYERLKITSSGNIYIVVDEKTLKKMESTMSTGYASLKQSIHSVPKKLNIADKASATFCYAKPDECDCLPNECICHDMVGKWDFDADYSMFIPKNSTQTNDCDPNISQDESSQNKKKIELFIPRTEARPTASSESHVSKAFSSTEQCFYNFLDTKYHSDNKKNDYEISSLLGSCKPENITSSSSWPALFEIDFDDTSNSNILDPDFSHNDSTFYLEYQLPYFLTNPNEKNK